MENQNNIKEDILQKIKSGQIRMKPRIFFVAKAGLFVLFFSALLFFAVYLVSFIVFMMRANGTLFLPRFGFYGLGVFLRVLPWALILLLFVLIVFSEFFAEHFAFVYKKPMLYSLAIIIIAVGGFGIVAAFTPMHVGIFKKAAENNFPFVRPFYEQIAFAGPENVHTGIVSGISETEFNIQTLGGISFKVIPCRRGMAKAPKRFLSGERVVVIGPVKNNIIECMNILKITDDGSLDPLYKMRKRMK